MSFRPVGGPSDGQGTGHPEREAEAKPQARASRCRHPRRREGDQPTSHSANLWLPSVRVTEEICTSCGTENSTEPLAHSPGRRSTSLGNWGRGGQASHELLARVY